MVNRQVLYMRSMTAIWMEVAMMKRTRRRRGSEVEECADLEAVDDSVDGAGGRTDQCCAQAPDERVEEKKSWCC